MKLLSSNGRELRNGLNEDFKNDENETFIGKRKHSGLLKYLVKKKYETIGRRNNGFYNTRQGGRDNYPELFKLYVQP